MDVSITVSIHKTPLSEDTLILVYAETQYRQEKYGLVLVIT